MLNFNQWVYLMLPSSGLVKQTDWKDGYSVIINVEQAKKWEFICTVTSTLIKIFTTPEWHQFKLWVRLQDVLWSRMHTFMFDQFKVFQSGNLHVYC